MTRQESINRVKELVESGKDPSVVFDEYLKHVNTLLHNIKTLTAEVSFLFPFFNAGLVFDLSVDGEQLMGMINGHPMELNKCLDNIRKLINSRDEGFTPPPVPGESSSEAAGSHGTQDCSP